MSRWSVGEADIERLLNDRHLQTVRGGQANGDHLLQRAARTLLSATEIAESDPDSAYVLAYDVVRYSGTALLAQQGLRPTTAGGHYAVEQALRAQFGVAFRVFGTMRRRRNELEYPNGPGEVTTQVEAAQSIDEARELLEAAQRLMPMVGLF